MNARATGKWLGRIGFCLLTLCWCAALLAAGEQPTTRPAVASAGELAGIIAAIEQASDPADALKAYARGLTVARDSAELHRAHMRKMLQAGLPQAAWAPARRLTMIDPADGLAWGVVGYTHARRNELSAAFNATLRAAERVTDDPGTMHNAGQLAAWFQNDPSPSITPQAIAILRKHYETWMQQPAYVEGFSAVEATYAVRQQRRDELESEMQLAREELDALETEARAIDAELHQMHSEITEIELNIELLEDELRDVEVDLHWAQSNYSRTSYLTRRRRDLEYQIDQQEVELKRRQGEHERRRREGQGVLNEYRRRKEALQQLQEKSEAELAGFRPRFYWKPPAVDGVITPERPMPAATTQPASAPSDPEAHATMRLKLAELYLQHNRPDKAAEILSELLRTHPQTAAAARAREMLAATSQPAAE